MLLLEQCSAIRSYSSLQFIRGFNVIGMICSYKDVGRFSITGYKQRFCDEGEQNNTKVTAQIWSVVEH